VNELVERIVSNVGIDAATAEKAVGIIMNFLLNEGPRDKVRELLARIPGGEAYAAQAAEPAESGFGGFGGFGGLGSLMGGGMMKAFNELTGAGLNMAQIQAVTRETVHYARDKAGEDLVGQVVGSIPGLSQFV
jgi:hypothetical protein